MSVRFAVLGVSVLLSSSCTGYLDPRCYSEPYYCRTGQQAEQYLREASDDRLIEIAAFDYRTAKPPSGHVVDEMARRGPSRARAILYSYAAGQTDTRLLDEMIRTFGELGNVCGRWVPSAPARAKPQIAKACYRVFESDQMKALENAADPSAWR